jgi:hypothetical protein
MRRMRDKADLVILGAANLLSWMAEMEQALKVVLLIVSIGYALHRWWHWSQIIKPKK